MLGSFLDARAMDEFSKADFICPKATASIKVGIEVKSEGELIISGTKAYICVPAPWWKTDYFEIRSESPVENKRYFYQLDGEGIRYELVAFMKMITAYTDGNSESSLYIDNISRPITSAISEIMEKFESGENVFLHMNCKCI